MTGIDLSVVEAFLDCLKESDDVPAAVREKLSIVLAEEKLPKPEELATLYRTASGDPVA